MLRVFRKNGLYLQYSESVGHTGTRKFVNWTDDINKATTFAWVSGTLRKEVGYDCEEIEVEETRTVRIKNEQ